MPRRDIRKVSKSTLSMYLRTKCDKELYLSLHDSSRMDQEGLPEPVKRPAIGLLATEGREFEVERNDQLVRLLPNIITFNRNANSYSNVNLQNWLISITTVPAVALQPEYSISSFQDGVLENIGLTQHQIALVPPIADFKPDILVVREPKDGDMEVCVDGSRKEINIAEEERLSIQIYDVKHTSEANPSYCAEIALYAVMLANFIASSPDLSEHFFVSLDAFLWTRIKQGQSKLTELDAAGTTDAELILDALTEDSENANLRFYLAAIREFYENVARVIENADTTPDAWRDLDWHVNSSCSNCDWLGDSRHISVAQRATVATHPENYCMPEAMNSGHLSLIPGITRGAKKILQMHSVPDATALSGAVGHPALQEHTALKKEAKNLPAKTSAILTTTIDRDLNSSIASLVPSANLHIYLSVNFDPSSGLLTGLAVSGVTTTFQPGLPPTRFRAESYIVDEKTLDAEWVVLEAFLTKIATCIDTAANLTQNPTGQIHLWEERQFTELCNAIGRHLPKVLALTERRAKALAWIFPPEEFLPTPNSLQASTVVIVEDLVRRLVFTPTPHVITLFDTVEHYNNGYPSIVRDSYYREYLNNSIPRERIYEIWSGLPQVKRGPNLLPRTNVIVEYSDALCKQPKALESICEKLRDDYRGHFRTSATRIPTSIPIGATRVAFDSKLWIWWDQLDFNARHLESHIRLVLDGERLEATYEAIILKNGTPQGNDIIEYDVSTGSLEAKFKEDSRLTLGKIGRPGMPLERISQSNTSWSPCIRWRR